MRFRFTGSLALALMIILVFSFFPGCGKDSPTSNEEEAPDWPDLTEREDVIETIRLCFENYKSVPLNDLESRYRDILYDLEDNEYVFFLKEGDYAPEEDPFLTLEEFVSETIYIWANSIELTLIISSATWEIYESGGCDNCWTTTRSYNYSTTMDVSGNIIESFRSGTISFIARAHHDDPSRWSIYVAYDLPPM